MVVFSFIAALSFSDSASCFMGQTSSTPLLSDLGEHPRHRCRAICKSIRQSRPDSHLCLSHVCSESPWENCFLSAVAARPRWVGACPRSHLDKYQHCRDEITPNTENSRSLQQSWNLAAALRDRVCVREREKKERKRESVCVRERESK